MLTKQFLAAMITPHSQGSICVSAEGELFAKKSIPILVSLFRVSFLRILGIVFFSYEVKKEGS